MGEARSRADEQIFDILYDKQREVFETLREKPSFGIVMVADDGDHMSVLAGNFVSHSESEMLSQRVHELQNSSADELRALYRAKLREPAETQSKGASLGLIEIARRSSIPLEYSMEDAGNGFCFFMIKASV